MRRLVPVVVLTGFAVFPATSDEAVWIRYSDPTSRLALELEHDISVPEHESIAGRRVSFKFDVIPKNDPDFGVTIESASGTYTAHGMEQRLSARHLTGREFTLSLADQGRRFVARESPPLSVGAPVSRGLYPAQTLAETLPVLPTEPVAEGTTWESERRIHSLEGWSWGTGLLHETHRVTAIERRGAHRIVTVEGRARASLEPIEAPGFTGTIERTYSWTFDATSGRLLSLSMNQTSSGLSPIQGGDVEVDQITTIELTAIVGG